VEIGAAAPVSVEALARFMPGAALLQRAAHLRRQLVGYRSLCGCADLNIDSG
jgi:hypothetical protein